jgi:hypothetical protein
MDGSTLLAQSQLTRSYKMAYKLTQGTCIVRATDNAYIPPDPDNVDYQAYLKWVEDGNDPEPYVAPEPTVEEKKSAINTQRDIDLLGGVSFLGNVFHSDDAFRADLTDMLLGYDKGLLTGVQNIRTLDNKIVQLDGTQILQLKMTIGMFRQQIFATSWAAKDALDVPETPPAV